MQQHIFVRRSYVGASIGTIFKREADLPGFQGGETVTWDKQTLCINGPISQDKSGPIKRSALYLITVVQVVGFHIGSLLADCSHSSTTPLCVCGSA